MSTAELAQGTNRSFEHSQTTTASHAAVWRRWTDTATWGKWDRGLKSATLQGDMRLGATGTIVPLSGPRARFEVIEFESGRRYAFTTKMPGARLTVRRSFVSADPTTFKHQVWFDGPFAAIWARLTGRGFRSALPPTMRHLSALCEADE